MRARLLLPLVAALALPNAGRAQADLPQRAEAVARRVAAIRDARVRFSYPVRDDVCGTGEGGIRTRPNEVRWGDADLRRDVAFDDRCEHGPARVVLDVSGGAVQRVRAAVGGRWTPADGAVEDLGELAPDVAAGLLLRVAQGSGLTATPRAAREAIFPATIARGAEPWPVLLRLARDSARPREARTQATFWLGNAAGDVAARGLTELADDPDRDVRLQAVFALSRRPSDEAVPALIRIARTHRDPATRRQALFWLGRSNDPRALALFEELLVARR